ncbi:dynamin family protein [Actinobacillus genomosp. 1]|uniref:dynamin family protein n=1 Tax=Actinobacillus genomosp. 1 TaxID=254839 RepID=UPI002441C216|nr:dynamin family protein [Actinobacillus genomosp. 1]WGE92026.1 dynamin family protein [Actinobacillus genomosp. 1]
MRNELQTIIEQLEQTSRVGFLFGKGKVVQQTTSQLAQVDAFISALETDKESLSSNLSNTKEQLSQSESNLEQTQVNLKITENKFLEQSDTLESVRRSLKRKEKEFDELDDELFDTQGELNTTKKDLKETQNKFEFLQEEHNVLSEEHEYLKSDFKKYRENTILREQLVGTLISAKNESPHLLAFKNILQNDFLAFAAKESSLEDEAGALLKLQQIANELEIVSAFPEFHSARTIAVGGGFSAGKSEFISSFFSDKLMKLPSSIEPTTAIPTYVVNSKGKKNQLIGVNKTGGTVNLTEIDPNLSHKLNHQFIQSFKFKLKDIMPYMFLTTKLAYKNICFVDTPGYNPNSSKGSHTEDDSVIAKEYVKDAEALIWLVGADANGTIPRTDINFLKEVLGTNKKPVYFVLNKADLRAESDVKKIQEEFVRVLKDANIRYDGISAYNSIEGKELTFYQKGKKLGDFLTSLDRSSNKQTEILRKLYEVETSYQFAIKKEIKERKALAEALDDISFNLNMANFKRGNHKIYDQLDEISSRFTTNLLEDHLNQLSKLMDEFTLVINNLFGKRSSVKRPNIDMDKIEIEAFDFELEAVEDESEENKSEENELSAGESELNKKVDPLSSLYSNIWHLFGGVKS